jgi:hypothetical protein
VTSSTGAGGRLPNFLIIGANKSGTTSLHRYLLQHPDVFLPASKEPMFFLLCDGTPLEQYVMPEMQATWVVSDLASYRQVFADAGDRRAVGEASTLYMTDRKVPREVRQVLDEPKLIAILRNPVDRAFSHYRMHRAWGVEPLETFEEAIEAEPQRVAAGWPLVYEYVDLGRYARQLRPFWEAFDTAHIRVCWYEDLERDSAGLVADLFRYLDVTPDAHVDTLRRWNAAERVRWRSVDRLARSPAGRTIRAALPRAALRATRRVAVERPPRLRSATRAHLVEVYRDDIRELQRATGRDLQHWLV